MRLLNNHDDGRLLQLESNHHHLKEDIEEIKDEVRLLREELVKLGNIISEKRGAVNMRRTIMYGIATFLSICAAFGLHQYLPLR